MHQINDLATNGPSAEEMQGQSLALSINGTVENNSIKGNLSAPMIPMPLEFGGKRAD